LGVNAPRDDHFQQIVFLGRFVGRSAHSVCENGCCGLVRGPAHQVHMLGLIGINCGP
tara:strand:+ start:527 stop:697 length:171 start_codon:yes stop_codon:yes gene_type:complete